MAQQELNPYATPRAQVADQPSMAAGATVFFPVGPLKLSVMSMATFGLYEVYWFYKNWADIKTREAININPVLRAVFYPLFAHSAFTRVKDKGAEVGAVGGYSSGALAIAVFLLLASTYLPDPFWLISLLSFVPLLPVQSAINSINARLAPGADGNTRFSGSNVFGIVLGLLFWAVVLAGLFMPIEAMD